MINHYFVQSIHVVKYLQQIGAKRGYTTFPLNPVHAHIVHEQNEATYVNKGNMQETIPESSSEYTL